MQNFMDFEQSYHRYDFEHFLCIIYYFCLHFYVRFKCRAYQLTHSFPMHPYGFLMFSGGRERVYWERWVKVIYEHSCHYLLGM